MVCPKKAAAESRLEYISSEPTPKREISRAMLKLEIRYPMVTMTRSSPNASRGSESSLDQCARHHPHRAPGMIGMGADLECGLAANFVADRIDL